MEARYRCGGRDTGGDAARRHGSDALGKTSCIQILKPLTVGPVPQRKCISHSYQAE